MSSFIPFSRDQSFLLPPDLRSWLPSDDVAHFIVAAVERVPLGAFAVPARTGGKPQYHPRLMLALLIHCHANGVFSSRRIERATYRDVAVRFVAALRAKLDAACTGLEAQARAEADAARPAFEAKKAAYDARKGRRGRPPKPPDDLPPPERQSNLTDPDSALMRRSDAHEYRQACNAQAVVCADGTQLVLATAVVATTADAPSLGPTVLGMEPTIGLPRTVLADTGYASRAGVAALQARGVEPLVAIGRTQP